MWCTCVRAIESQLCCTPAPFHRPPLLHTQHPLCIHIGCVHVWLSPPVHTQNTYQASTAPAPPSHAELVKEAQKLVDLAKSKATQEQLDQQAELLVKLSEAAGTNKVVADLNDGKFRGYTLTVGAETTDCGCCLCAAGNLSDCPGCSHTLTSWGTQLHSVLWLCRRKFNIRVYPQQLFCHKVFQCDPKPVKVTGGCCGRVCVRVRAGPHSTAFQDCHYYGSAVLQQVPAN